MSEHPAPGTLVSGDHSMQHLIVCEGCNSHSGQTDGRQCQSNPSPPSRYTDSAVRSERAGQRVMESVTRFITNKLKLKVNETKSAVARPQERKFLGFSFTHGPEVKRAIAPKALERFKRRIRDITRRAKSVSLKA